MSAAQNSMEHFNMGSMSQSKEIPNDHPTQRLHLSYYIHHHRCRLSGDHLQVAHNIAETGNQLQKPNFINWQRTFMNNTDWSKIYRKKASNNTSWVDDNNDDDDRGDSSDEVMNTSWDSDVDEEDDGSMVPPHEWIARKLARSQISSFSFNFASLAAHVKMYRPILSDSAV